MSIQKKTKRINRKESNDRITAIEGEQKEMNKTLGDINVTIGELGKDLKYNNQILSEAVKDNKTDIEKVRIVARNTAIKIDQREQQKKGQKILIKKWSKIIGAIGAIIIFIIKALDYFKVI